MARFSQIFLAGALVATGQAQTTWFVDASASSPGDGTPDSPFTAIQAALDASAAAGDTVRVLTGTYAENLTLDGKSVELMAASGIGSVVVDGNQGGPAFTVLNHPTGQVTTCTGMRFQNGLGEVIPSTDRRGGGLYVPGPATTAFESCEFTGNRADEGGGAYLDGGVHTFVNCAFDANFGDLGGGLCAAGTRLVLQSCSASDNGALTPPDVLNADIRGLGIALVPPSDPGARPEPTLIEDCEVSRNFSLRIFEGGGISSRSGGDTMIRHTSINGNGRPPEGQFAPPGGRGAGIAGDPSTTLSHCEIRDNGLAFISGGGVFGIALAQNCVITGNQAADGGGVFVGRYEDCLIEGNTAAGISSSDGARGGGAIFATLIRCTLRGNQALEGPVRVGGGAHSCNLEDCLVEFNFLAGASTPFSQGGGGISSCLAVDTVIRHNSGTNGGGADDCSGSDRGLIRCTITDNIAFETGGGALSSTLVDCVVQRNHAGIQGGGAAICSLERCVLSGNTAGICAGAAGCDLDFCTITGNRASGQIGGVGSSDEFLPPHLPLTTSMTNSIVYANEPDDFGEAEGEGPGNPIATAEWSIVQGGWPGTGNIDANGLVTGPYSGNAQLLAGSPAIDAADPAAPQDSDGSRADMGAIPFDPTFVPEPTDFCVGKQSSVGVIPQISWSGSPTLSGADDFELLGTDLNGGSFALVALSPNPAATQAFGGTICLGPGLVRLGVVATGGVLGSADGAVTLSLGQSELQAFGAGSLLYAQMLIRDSANPDGSGAALTAGLEFRVLP